MARQEFLLYTDSEICEEIAGFVAKRRISMGITQKEFAKRVGISYRTYQVFEQTGNISLERLIGVLRHIGALKEMLGFMDMDLGNRSIVEAKAHMSVKTRVRASTPKIHGSSNRKKKID